MKTLRVKICKPNKRIICGFLSVIMIFSLMSINISAADELETDTIPDIIQSLPWENIVKGNITQSDCANKANIIIFGRITCGNTTSYLNNINRFISGYSIKNKINILFFDVDQPYDDVKDFMQISQSDYINAFSGGRDIMWDAARKAGYSNSVTFPMVIYIDDSGKTVLTTTAYQEPEKIINNVSLVLDYDITKKVGDPAGDVLYSDITAYINGQMIPTSIINGKTLVTVEDLSNYGFDVVWNSKNKTLNVELNKNKIFSPIAVTKDTQNKPGTFKEKYVYADIKAYLSGQLVESFAIKGVTLIDFDALGKYGTFAWDAKTREIKLTIK